MTIVFKFFPSLNGIWNITNGYPSVVRLFLPVNYVVNQFISLRVPPEFGMVQATGKTARIMAVNTGANTVTLDLDTTSFDPYVLPIAFTQLPLTIPSGEFGSTLAASVRDNVLRAGYVPV